MWKVLFLDIDGVLNSERWIESISDKGHGYYATHFDPEAIARLNRIIEQTGAKIVISSTWRKMYTLERLRELLATNGCIGEVIGQTPAHFSYCQRGHEIQDWLDEQNEIPAFLILDDNADMDHLLPYLVQTPFETGLGDEQVEAAVRILTGASP